METRTFSAILDETLSRLEVLTNAVSAEQRITRSARVELLAAALTQQLEELTATICRIRERQSPRALERAFALADPLPALAPVPERADSRAFTTWLLQALGLLVTRFELLASQRRLGSAAAAVREIARLLSAQSRRFALEAQRFEDL